MEVKIFNLKIMKDELTSMNNRLLPYYKRCDITSLYKNFEEKGFVSTLNVDGPEIDWDIALDMSQEPHATDYENVKRLYEGLKQLPPTIAARQEFWAWYAHAKQYEYVIYRSEVRPGEYDEISVRRDFFCLSTSKPGKTEDGPRRMLTVNLLSRLWWAGRLMYDDKNENPYHFVELITQSAFNSNIMLLASSTATNKHEIFMGLLEALEEFKTQYHLPQITRNHFVPCTKYLNSIGAVRMIDTLSRSEIKEICLDVLDQEFRD